MRPLAPYYDEFTRHHRDTWLERLETLARVPTGSAGAAHVLDVACRTGKSLLPLVRRSYDGAGRDLSADMLARARVALPERLCVRRHARPAPLDQDLRLDHLPRRRPELPLGRRRPRQRWPRWRNDCCAPGGLLTFDLNSLSAHREGFATRHTGRRARTVPLLGGRGCEPDRGEPGSADISIFERAGDASAAPQVATSSAGGAPTTSGGRARRPGSSSLSTASSRRAASARRRRARTLLVYLARRSSLTTEEGGIARFATRRSMDRAAAGRRRAASGCSG